MKTLFFVFAISFNTVACGNGDEFTGSGTTDPMTTGGESSTMVTQATGGENTTMATTGGSSGTELKATGGNSTTTTGGNSSVSSTITCVLGTVGCACKADNTCEGQCFLGACLAKATAGTGGSSSTGGTSSIVAATGGKTAVNTTSTGGSATGGASHATGGAQATGGASTKATGGTPGTGGLQGTGGSSTTTHTCADLKANCGNATTCPVSTTSTAAYNTCLLDANQDNDWTCNAVWSSFCL